MKPTLELPTAEEALKAYNEAKARFAVPQDIVLQIRNTIAKGRETKVKVYIRPDWLKDMTTIQERLRYSGYETEWVEGDPRDPDDFGILVIDWWRGGQRG